MRAPRRILGVYAHGQLFLWQVSDERAHSLTCPLGCPPWRLIDLEDER